MLMALFRQGRPVTHLDHQAAMMAASSPDDVELVSWAFLHGRPCLTAIDDLPTIIAPQSAGDDGLSWEALYDTAMTLRDYRRVKEHGVQTLEELKPVLFRIRLIAQLGDHPYVDFFLKSANDQAGRTRLAELVNEEEFRRELTLHLAERILTSDTVKLVSAGALKVNDPAPDDAPEWEFITPDGD